MSSIDFTKRSFGTMRPQFIGMAKHEEDSRRKTMISIFSGWQNTKRIPTKNDKIDFFRHMGLELSKCVSNDSNNNDCDTLAKIRSRSSSRCSLTSIGEFYVKGPEECFSRESTSKQKHVETRHPSDMTDSLKKISHTRACSVAIIGDKCKVCGKSFKCIKDVQIHVRRKHRRKKPRKNLIFKIGGEIISRVPIKRKYLRWPRRTEVNTVDNSEKTDSSSNDELIVDRARDEERVPFVDLDSDCDVNDSRSIFTETETRGDLLRNVKNQNIDKDSDCRGTDEDEEIQVLLRITRPRSSGPAMEINHETPNRAERELLITDAIRELVRMDDGPTDVNGSEGEKDFDNEIANECYWPEDGTLSCSHLDREERNCSFHIEYENDIEFTSEPADSPTKINNNAYYDDDKASLHSRQFVDRSDIVPKLMDNAPGFNDSVSYPYNNNVYEFDDSFYNDSGINEWRILTGVSRSINCDGQCTKPFVGSSVLIKEEIMLDDLL